LRARIRAPIFAPSEIAVAKRKKIAFIGAGNVGATCAHLCFLRALGDIVLYDIIDGLPQGKALDMLQSGPVLGIDVDVIGTTDIADIAGADCCVVTSGSPRRPGMSRDDLLKINAAVMNTVGKAIKEHAPDSLIIAVTNPLDAMVTQLKRVTSFPKNRIVGQAGVLDSARYRTFLAAELGVSVDSVHAMVLGGHGDDMVPVRSYTTCGGVPIDRVLKPARLEEIETRTRNGGGEIVNLMKTSSYYAAGTAVYRMVEAAMLDKKEVLPCAAYLEGEYGVNGLYAGVPVVIGGGGVEKIIEIELTAAERKAFDSSVAHVRELVEAMDKVIAAG
jgi:malate dehydrogenase